MLILALGRGWNTSVEGERDDPTALEAWIVKGPKSIVIWSNYTGVKYNCRKNCSPGTKISFNSPGAETKMKVQLRCHNLN